MFGREWLGPRLALAHYIGAFLVGLIFRFYGAGEDGARPEPRREGHILARAVRRLLEARRADGRPLGQLLGDAVTDSIRTLLMICGFIMLFSVMVRMLDELRLAGLVAAPLSALFRLLGLAPDLVRAAVAGILEIDLGTVAASQAQAPLWQQAVLASAVIAWSGLSVHGQVASVLTGTDIRMGPYAAARLLHAILAAVATVPLVGGAGEAHLPVVPAFAPLAAGGGPVAQILHGALWAVLLPLALAAVGVVAAVLGSVRIWGFYHRRA